MGRGEIQDAERRMTPAGPRAESEPYAVGRAATVMAARGEEALVVS